MSSTIVNCDNMDASRGLPSLADASVDSLVTDPPAGIGFMGHRWDSSRGGGDVWVRWLAGVMRECGRVLKPGAHAVVWALPRTSHWTATALDDAGFEVRDVVHHIFGTGFPKSLNVPRAIDAQLGKGMNRPLGRGGRAGSKRRPGGYGLGAEYSATPAVTPAAKRWDGWGTALKPAAEHWILARRPLVGTVADNAVAHGTGASIIGG
jgi:hypothetical protein